MLKWEYRREHALDIDELNRLGKKGWELICFDNGTYYFKRRIDGLCSY